MAVTNGKPNNMSMAYHWARMIEVLHCREDPRAAERPGSAGHRPHGQGRAPDEAVGILEAPRGTLFHHYEVNENDQVTMCNLIVSTTSNNEPMNRAVEGRGQEPSPARRSPKAC
jgi:NAD-reducing hydrogenase large subunit